MPQDLDQDFERHHQFLLSIVFIGANIERFFDLSNFLIVFCN